MNIRRWLARLGAQEDLNFLLTNRVPRIALTRFMGRFSQVEQPLVRDLSLAVWRMFADLELDDTEQRAFKSMRDCFTRGLRPGARPIDPDPGVIVSPCDAILGAHGAIAGTAVFQAKGFPYRLDELLPDPMLAAEFRDGCFATLRITSSMYHRFHAPDACRVTRVDYVSGDTWNVNPIALRRVERLFCRNERAVLRMTLDDGTRIALVAVAAILVASIRLHFADVRLHLRYRGKNPIECDYHARRGEELGWFEQGSTMLVFAPAGYQPCPSIREGDVLRMGQPLFRKPGRNAAELAPPMDPSATAARPEET
jgi:phosphatidylserine decarboxylase